MPVTLIKMLPSILRIGGLLLIFGLGWYSKSVLVENRELKTIQGQLEAANVALVEYEQKVGRYTDELDTIKRELNEENTPSCKDTINPCLRRGFDRLLESRK